MCDLKFLNRLFLPRSLARFVTLLIPSELGTNNYCHFIRLTIYMMLVGPFIEQAYLYSFKAVFSQAVYSRIGSIIGRCRFKHAAQQSLLIYYLLRVGSWLYNMCSIVQLVYKTLVRVYAAMRRSASKHNDPRSVTSNLNLTIRTHYVNRRDPRFIYITFETRAHCWTISSRKSFKKIFFSRGPIEGTVEIHFF